MLASLTLPTDLEAWWKAYPFLPGLLFAVFCLGLLLILAAPRIGSWRRAKGRPVLGPLQLEAMLTGAGALVVDLRDNESFATGHIRGCLHVPFGELATRFAKPDPTARRAIVLVDEDDRLSHQAFDLLSARGFSWVYILKGGMRAWRQASRPMGK